jgi:homoserine dehydrogenase
VKLLLLGFGNVGQRLAEILAGREAYPSLAGLDVSVVGITTSSKGSIADPAGLDLRSVLNQIRNHGRFPQSLTSLEAIRTLDYDVMVEMTPLDIPGRGAAAIAHVREALERGHHVITCNKGPLAWAYRPLRDLARRQSRAFLYETTVMDGAPVFNLAQRCLRGNTIQRIEGVLNSTSNYVLCAMERGQSQEEAVKAAQALGVAEADPRNDLDGWDAAVKTAALANVLLDAEITPEEVERESMAAISPETIREALARGQRIKMVCEARQGGTRVIGRVAAREVPHSDPFALVEGTGSILRLTTDIAGKIVLTEEDPNLSTTAYGVLSDLYRLAELTGTSRTPPHPGPGGTPCSGD